ANLRALSQNDIFCGARALDDEGKVFAELGFPNTFGTDQTLISETVFFDDPTDKGSGLKSIGTLEVCATVANVKYQIADILQRIITVFGILSIAILLASHLSLQILLEPLRRFKVAMGEFLVSMRPISDPYLLRENEVGDIVQSFNILAISLSESYRALKKAKEQAEEAIKVKTDFFANMSHELRTPLNSVIGMTQLLQSQKMDSEQMEMFDSIKRSADNLLQIVNDILDVSKMEAGQIQLEYLAFDAFREVRHTVQALKPLATQKDLDLSIEVIGDKAVVFGDAMRFCRIVTNLVSNAIRYTERGSIKIYVRTIKTRESRLNLTVEVEDTGIGIPQGKLETIFEKFSQADNSTTRKYGGTGLGLTITRELIQLMGGEIYVTSEYGKGSVFSFTIPFEIAPEEELAKIKRADTHLDASAAPTTGIPVNEARILMAEDHPMNQTFIRKLAKNLGMLNYTLVENGKDAVNELNLNSYDLVLMDCHMPEMNGYDATIAIRNLDDPIRRSVPIVAMTANAMPEDEQRCLACGMTGYISKPIDIGNFKKVLSPWINFNYQAPAAPVKMTEEQMDMAPPYDLTNLKANSMGDADFEREIISMFVSQASAQLAALESLCVDGPNEQWVEEAHALKGTAGSVGATKLRDMCAKAQSMANATALTRSTKVSRLRSEYEMIVGLLKKDGHYKES
ncbi:MAG: response regulator, partial [Alphaproteobacteria bacterium]|nr:response regulator [Alphaproteobacteria bacterium]